MMKTATNWYEDANCLECITCGSKLLNSGNSCSKCMTPLDVSRTVSERGKAGSIISVLGASGAGKTVYLGMLLDMLSKGWHDLQGLPNGAFSMAVQEQTIGALESRRFPEKTSSEPDRWNWVHCEATNDRRRKRSVDIITPDLAGEALALELDNANSNATIRALIDKSAGMILLFDSKRVRDAGRTEDLFGMKLLTYIASLHSRTKKERRRKIRIPISVVMTKSDECPEAMVDARGFVAENMPGMMRQCKQRFAFCSYFAASVVGSSIASTDQYGAEISIPLHIQPAGIVEPLEWIMSNLDRR